MQRIFCRFPRTTRGELGFSLVELMIALALGLALIATLGYVYLGAKSSYNHMDALATIQETARFTFEYMGEDIRMAGYTGGPANGGTPVNAVSPPAAFDPSLIDLFDRPLLGYEQDGAFPAGVAPLAGTDAVTVIHADQDRETSLCLAADAPATCTANNVPGLFTLRFDACPSAGLPEAGQVFVASDYTHSAVFQITSVGACGGGSLAVRYDGAAAPGNSTTDLGVFSGAIQARKVLPLRASTYYVANDASGVPTLFVQELTGSAGSASARTAQLAQWVEGLQVQYGVDLEAAPDQSVDAYFDADDVDAGSNGAVSIAPATLTLAGRWERVLSVRVSLTLTSRPDASITTTGGPLTKTFTNTFSLRNRLL